MLATKNTVNRFLNLLFPLEFNNENEDATNVDMRRNNETNDNPNDDDQKLTNEEKKGTHSKKYTKDSSGHDRKFLLAAETTKKETVGHESVANKPEHSLCNANRPATSSVSYCTNIYLSYIFRYFCNRSFVVILE